MKVWIWAMLHKRWQIKAVENQNVFLIAWIRYRGLWSSSPCSSRFARSPQGGLGRWSLLSEQGIGQAVE